MTYEEFEFHFQKMVKAFRVRDAGRSIDAYFEEFKAVDQSLFAAATSKIIRTPGRYKFPSVGELIGVIETLPGALARDQWEPCVVCDGHGWVTIANSAFRGNCKHGERLSKQIAVAPANSVAIKGVSVRLHNEYFELYKREMPVDRVMVGLGKPHWWHE